MDKIASYVEAMFSTLPKTKEVVDMKLQIIEHMQDKFAALLEQGHNENEALGIVISEFGSIDEIRRELHLKEVYDEDVSYPAWAPFPAEEDEELERLRWEYYTFKPRAYLARAVAVALFILCPMVGGSMMYEGGEMLTFGMIAAGVGILIYFNGRLKDYATLINDRRAQLGVPLSYAPPEEEEPEPRPRRRKAAYTALWLAAVIFYLLIGFYAELWHPGWIVFLVVPLITSLLDIFQADREHEGGWGPKNK